MSKRFSIHEWQAKQRRLVEQDDYNAETQDVSGESMSNADIGALQKIVGNYSLEKILKTVAILADRGGMHDEAHMLQQFASKMDIKLDEYGSMRLPTHRSRASSFSVGGSKQYDSPGGEGKMAKGDVIELAKDAEDVVEMIGPESNLPEWVEAKITKAAEYINTVKDYLSNYDASREEMDEVNTLGGASSGASFTPGKGMGYFGRKKKKTKSGYMGYSEPVNEQLATIQRDQETDTDPDPESNQNPPEPEKEMSQDVEVMLKQVSRINTKAEFVELFNAILDLEVRGMSDAMKAQLLRNAIKEL